MIQKFEIFLVYLSARGREVGTWKCLGTALVYLASRYGITLTSEECMLYSSVVYVAVGIFAPDAKNKADVIIQQTHPEIQDHLQKKEQES